MINEFIKRKNMQRNRIGVPDGGDPRPSAAPGLGVCEWRLEGLHDKSVSLIPNTDEILTLVKKKMN